MKGLIFNLLADLAARAGCEDEAWDVALITAGSLLGRQTSDQWDLEDDDDWLEALDMPALDASRDTFRSLLRHAPPLCGEQARASLRPHQEEPAPSVRTLEPKQLSLFPNEEVPPRRSR
ncbi:MAG TPA: hypothetical protein VH142_12995 [Polyangiaceae bacterium]|jgi:hypothetical protein|nr:hypothetical protein [Polyangiaceae bacterium]